MSGLRTVGHVEITVDGHIVFEDHNLITNVGLSHIAGLLNGVQTTPFKYVGLGLGTSPADAGDVELENEKLDDGVARKLADTIDTLTTTVTDDTARLIVAFDALDNFDLTEIGLFNALTDGVMGAHRVFSPVSVLNGQTVVVTWTLIVTAG